MAGSFVWGPVRTAQSDVPCNPVTLRCRPLAQSGAELALSGCCARPARASSSVGFAPARRASGSCNAGFNCCTQSFFLCSLTGQAPGKELRFRAPGQERRPKFSSRSRACVPLGRLRGVAVRRRAPQQQPVGCLPVFWRQHAQNARFGKRDRPRLTFRAQLCVLWPWWAQIRIPTRRSRIRVATVLRCAVCAWIRRVALRRVVTPAANPRASRLAQLRPLPGALRHLLPAASLRSAWPSCFNANC